MVGIVGGEEDGALPRLPQARDQAQRARLVAEIQCGGRLSSTRSGRSCRQRAGNQHHLTLAARHAGIALISQMTGPDLNQRGAGGIRIGTIWLPEQPAAPRHGPWLPLRAPTGLTCEAPCWGT